MKKSIIASLAVLASAAVLTTFALGGAGKFGGVRVNADPKEYSVTFDGSESTTVEGVGGCYAIGTTTENGNKVGVVGDHSDKASFTFNGVPFGELVLCEYESYVEGAQPFSTITGFAISFSAEEAVMDFTSIDEGIYDIESGKEYKGLSITPDNYPRFMATAFGEGGSVTVTSLTIWYSC